MPIKIVLPEGKGTRTGHGTKVFTDSGVEITGISHMTIDVGLQDVITARMQVTVESIENLEGIKALLQPGEFEKLIYWAKNIRLRRSIEKGYQPKTKLISDAPSVP